MRLPRKKPFTTKNERTSNPHELACQKRGVFLSFARAHFPSPPHISQQWWHLIASEAPSRVAFADAPLPPRRAEAVGRLLIYISFRRQVATGGLAANLTLQIGGVKVLHTPRELPFRMDNEIPEL